MASYMRCLKKRWQMRTTLLEADPAHDPHADDGGGRHGRRAIERGHACRGELDDPAFAGKGRVHALDVVAAAHPPQVPAGETAVELETGLWVVDDAGGRADGDVSI